MTISGRIIDDQMKSPIQGATVTLTDANGNSLNNATSTNDVGAFALNNVTLGQFVLITHISYQPVKVKIETSNFGFIPMDRKITELPPVVVTNPTGSKFPWWILLAGGAAYAISKDSKKSVGKIQTGDIVTVGAAAALLLGLDSIKKIFEGLGFWDSKEVKEVDSEIENPNSPFSTQFWHAAPSGSFLLTENAMLDLGARLLACFGPFSDDEATAIGLFKTFKTQSQVSQFAEAWKDCIGGAMWRKYGGGDLLTWLRGSGWPDDRLSSEEVAQIINIVKKLPKYKP